MIVERLVGTVKWLNIMHGYGFTTRTDTQENVFALRAALDTESRLEKDENVVIYT